MTPTLVQNIATKYANKLQRNMSRIKEKMCLRKCKLCKSNVKTIVFEGFANWIQDDGNQQKYVKQYIKILPKLMTNPCRIDARKRNAQTWKMTPTWRQNGSRNRSKNMKKQYKKTSRKMMQKLSAKKL